MRYLIVLFLLSTVAGYSQSNDVIEVSYDKSILLIFGTPEDPGSQVVAENCGSPESVGRTKRQNKIILQANEEYFSETNLLVELKNGDVYVFILKYNNSTQKLKHTFALQSNSATPQPVIVRKDGEIKTPVAENNAKEQRNYVQTNKATELTDDDQIMFWAEHFSKEKDYITRLALVTSKFVFYVGGIWVKDDKMYFKINLLNESLISYDIQSRNFFIKANKSIEPEPVKLLGIYNDGQKKVQGKTMATFVAVFDKFTIGEKKVFIIQYWEKGGERNFELQIKANELLNAKQGL